VSASGVFERLLIAILCLSETQIQLRTRISTTNLGIHTQRLLQQWLRTKTKTTTIKSTIRKIKTKNTSSRRGICLSFSSLLRLLQLRLTPRFSLLFSSTSPSTPCHNHTQYLHPPTRSLSRRYSRAVGVLDRKDKGYKSGDIFRRRRGT